MVIPVASYSLSKMHWHPEHAPGFSQWTLEQRLNVSSTTSSPVHKSEFYMSRSHGCYNYPWANDDISALTASNLLKQYADKYTGALESPYQDQGTIGILNFQKTEHNSWPMTPSTNATYALVPPEVFPTKAPATGSRSSVVSNLSDSGFSGSSSNEYQTSYNDTYPASGYCSQPSPPRTPASLHTFQTTPSLVPSYSPSTPLYNYRTRTYPPQTSLTTNYSHTSAAYFPALSSSSYSSNSESGESMGRRGLDLSLENEVGGISRNRECTNYALKDSPNSSQSVDTTNECRGNRVCKELQNLKPLLSPHNEGTGKYSPNAGMMGDKSGPDRTFTHQSLSGPTVGTLKNPDPLVLDHANRELLDLSPAICWSELVGLTKVKAALEEDLLCPTLKPSSMIGPPKTILLFGPRGGGKTTLTRSLAAQLGASFYLVNAALLVSKGKVEVRQVLGSLLQVAVARQPSVVLLNQVEVLEEEGLGLSLLNALEKAQVSTGLLVFVCATARPDLLQDIVHRSFAKRYCVNLPDAGMRRQVLLNTLTPLGCGLSEQELSAVLQRTDGFSIRDLLQLSEQASALARTVHCSSAASGIVAFTDYEIAFSKVRPHTATCALDMYLEQGVQQLKHQQLNVRLHSGT